MVAAYILDDAGAFPVFPRRQLLDDACAYFTRTSKCRIHVPHTHLDDVRHAAAARRNTVGTGLGHNDCTVQADAQLSAVTVTNPHPFLECERRFEPRDRCAHILTD